MLKLDSLSCGYGSMEVLHGLDLIVPQGGITALLGANGAGKSSTIMCLAGHVEVQGGRVLYDDQEITGWSPVQRVRAGIALVPEGRRLFSRLSVKENLIVGGYISSKQVAGERMESVVAMFPWLKERLNQRAGSLSGGEQQMLAIGRALMSEPKLLLLDELSLGLMPKIIDLCYQAVSELKKQGLTMVLVEQSTSRALEVADQVCVLESGRAVWLGSAQEARSSSELIEAYLGLKVQD